MSVQFRMGGPRDFRAPRLVLEAVGSGLSFSLSVRTGAEAAGKPCGNAKSRRLELSPKRDEAQGLGNLGAREA